VQQRREAELFNLLGKEKGRRRGGEERRGRGDCVQGKLLLN